MQRPFRSQSPYRVGSGLLFDPGDAPRLPSELVAWVKVRRANTPSCDADFKRGSIGEVGVWNFRIAETFSRDFPKNSRIESPKQRRENTFLAPMLKHSIQEPYLLR